MRERWTRRYGERARPGGGRRIRPRTAAGSCSASGPSRTSPPPACGTAPRAVHARTPTASPRCAARLQDRQQREPAHGAERQLDQASRLGSCSPPASIARQQRSVWRSRRRSTGARRSRSSGSVRACGHEVERRLEERAGVARPQTGRAPARGARRPAAGPLLGRGHAPRRGASARCSIAAASSAWRGLEVVQVRAAREAGALGDAARRRVRVAVLDEARDRRVEQRLARGGAALGLACAAEVRSLVACILSIFAFMHERFRGSVRARQQSPDHEELRRPMAATEALVFDAIRTPRGKGKFNGSLHATKPVDLVVGLMHEMLIRNEQLDPARVDDVVLGCVSPGRRPGRRHRQDRRDQGRPAGHRRRRAAQPLLRLRPRGGQHRRAEGRLRLGGPRLRRRRRVDVARADGLRRRRLGDGPGDQLRHLVRARRASAPT